MSDVTRTLQDIEGGDPRAAEQLLPLVYDELRKLAAARMAAEPAGHTLQPTALVHEAYLRLVGDGACPGWDGRGHFFAAAAEAMRRILIDRARAARAEKRGGRMARIDVDAVDVAVTAAPDQVLLLDEALARLSAHDAAAGRLVELRYFAGLTVAEAGAALGVSSATAYRLWDYARSWLHSELRDAAGE
jgi:RNA polymerase sigma factor (TIGR02999 family)